MKNDIYISGSIKDFFVNTENTNIDSTIGIKCGICDELTSFNYNQYPTGFFLCDQCKHDLKEFVLSKRK